MSYQGCPECLADLHPSVPCECPADDCPCDGGGELWYDLGPARLCECGTWSVIEVNTDGCGNAWAREVSPSWVAGWDEPEPGVRRRPPRAMLKGFDGTTKVPS